MKTPISTTLLALATITLMVMTVSSSGSRGLQSLSVEGTNILAPSVKITGVSTLLDILNSATDYTDSAFDVLTIDSYSQSVTDQGVVYQGQVTLANDHGVNVTGIITGVYDPVGQSLNFKVTEAAVASTEPESNVTNTTVVVPPEPADFTYISPADLANDLIAEGALNWGYNALVQKIIGQYKLPAADPEYNVTNLLNAAYKNISTGAVYKFQVHLMNALNYMIDANITVYYTAKTQTYRINGYSFHSYGYPADAIVIPKKHKHHSSSPSNATNATVPANTTQSTGNNTAPSNVTAPSNTTVPEATNGTVVANTTGTVGGDTVVVITVPPVSDTTPVANTTTNASTNATVTPTPQANQASPGFTLISAEQLANDTQAQAALQDGINALIQKIISQDKLPAANPTYTINNVTLAEYKKQVMGITYKFDVNATNVDHVHLDASITVFYRFSTKAYSLNGYVFHDYGYSPSALKKTEAHTSTHVVSNTTASNSTVIDTPASSQNTTTGSN